jgi:hypothetical protein
MRKLILAFLICTSTAAFAQKTNFSGTWQLDTVKTIFGDGPHWIIPKTVKVSQTANALVLTRVSLNSDMQEQPPVTETLSFDGKPFSRPSGDATITTALTWTDNAGFTLTRKGASSNATENWTLEDGGKTLVIDRAVKQNDGFQYTIKCYYTKQ